MPRPRSTRFHPGSHAALRVVAVAVLFLACWAAPRAAMAEDPPPFLTMWGSYGSGPGNLSGPWGVTVDAAGFVYVAEQGNHRVSKFTSEGAFISSWGSGQLTWPSGIAADNAGHVFVADYGASNIKVFTTDGTFVGTFGDGDLHGPYDVATGPAGTVYVANHGSGWIDKYDSNGAHLAILGQGVLEHPGGVAVDARGTVYVSDENADRVVVFDPSGNQRLAFGDGGGEQPGAFFGPAGLDIDLAGNIYVADHGNNRVQKFAPSGTLLTYWGGAGNDPGEFNVTLDVSIGPDGAIYVTDTGNQRVQKFGVAVPDTTPGPPLPIFSTVVPGQPESIILGETFDITLGVRNVGYTSDDGRIVVSFPSLSDPGDGPRVTCSSIGDTPGFRVVPAGGTLTRVDCSPMTASYLLAEYADSSFRRAGVGHCLAQPVPSSASVENSPVEAQTESAKQAGGMSPVKPFLEHVQ